MSQHLMLSFSIISLRSAQVLSRQFQNPHILFGKVRGGRFPMAGSMAKLCNAQSRCCVDLTSNERNNPGRAKKFRHIWLIFRYGAEMALEAHW